MKNLKNPNHVKITQLLIKEKEFINLLIKRKTFAN